MDKRDLEVLQVVAVGNEVSIREVCPCCQSEVMSWPNATLAIMDLRYFSEALDGVAKAMAKLSTEYEHIRSGFFNECGFVSEHVDSHLSMSADEYAAELQAASDNAKEMAKHLEMQYDLVNPWILVNINGCEDYYRIEEGQVVCCEVGDGGEPDAEYVSTVTNPGETYASAVRFCFAINEVFNTQFIPEDFECRFWEQQL